MSITNNRLHHTRKYAKRSHASLERNENLNSHEGLNIEVMCSEYDIKEHLLVDRYKLLVPLAHFPCGSTRLVVVVIREGLRLVVIAILEDLRGRILGTSDKPKRTTDGFICHTPSGGHLQSLGEVGWADQMDH